MLLVPGHLVPTDLVFHLFYSIISSINALIGNRSYTESHIMEDSDAGVAPTSSTVSRYECHSFPHPTVFPALSFSAFFFHFVICWPSELSNRFLLLVQLKKDLVFILGLCCTLFLKYLFFPHLFYFYCTLNGVNILVDSKLIHCMLLR